MYTIYIYSYVILYIYIILYTLKIIDTTNELLGRLKRQNSLRISRAVLYLAIFPQIGRATGRLPGFQQDCHSWLIGSTPNVGCGLSWSPITNYFITDHIFFSKPTPWNIMKSSICWQDNHTGLDRNRKCQKFGPKPGATNCDFCSECDSSLVSFVGTTSWSPWFITILDHSAIKNNSHHNSGFLQLWRVFGSTHLDRTQSACIPSQPFFRMKYLWTIKQD